MKKIFPEHTTLLITIVFFIQSIMVIPLNADESEKRLQKNDIIALFLMNCAYFCTWPKDNPKTTKELNIGIIGEYAPLAKAIEKNANRAYSSWLQGGKINVYPINKNGKKINYQIIFVESYDGYSLRNISNQYKNSGILLVSDLNLFAINGGSIEIRIVDNNLRFILNLDAIPLSGIDISSKLKKRAMSFVLNGKEETNNLMEQ